MSSVGNFTDLQARRSNIRVRVESGTRPVCTLNGSALATPQLWATIVEQGQLPDETGQGPEVLVPYLGKDVLNFLPPQGRHRNPS